MSGSSVLPIKAAVVVSARVLRGHERARAVVLQALIELALLRKAWTCMLKIG